MIRSQSPVGAYEIGPVKRLPVPTFDPNSVQKAARTIYALVDTLENYDETSRWFCSPPPVTWDGRAIVDSIRNLVFEALENTGMEPDEPSLAMATEVLEQQVADLCHSAVWPSFLVGVAFERWSTEEANVHCAADDPFASVPSHQLRRANDDSRLGPVVLVDDAGASADIVARFLVVRDEVQNVPQEMSGLLSEIDIRQWLAEKFFAFHIRKYSASRRSAPIYWQLATPSTSYSVWLYYHRFTKDTFYKVLNDYVTPKLQHEERKLTQLVQTTGANPTASQRKEIAEQEAFVEELRVFREEIARIAPLWNPDLNDGVIINFAPLWRLVPQHRAWQKECKACWDKLIAGDYDWSHLAMHLWPERIVPKCAEDRSLAIAHGLEEVFWVEGDTGKWQPRRVDPSTIDQLIKERTSAAVKGALKSLLEAPAPMTTRRTSRAKGTRRKSPAKTSRSAATNAPDPSMLVQGRDADGSITKAGEPRGDRYGITGEEHA